MDDLGTLEETELIDRSRRGDGAAFGELARRHGRDALRVAHAMLGSPAEADDVVQEAMMKAYRALDRFRAEAPLRPWLLRIVANEARNRRRSAGRRGRLAERVAATSAAAGGGGTGVGLVGGTVVAASAESAALVDERAREVLRALARLRAPDREVIVLRYFAELSEAEMASALGCPPGTVKSRLSRALARLRPFVGPEVDHG